MDDHFAECAARMRQADLPDSAVRAFAKAYRDLLANDPTLRLIWERSLRPVAAEDLRHMDSLPARGPDRSLLQQAAVLKLNGGLGTSMGLERPKSLLRVKGDATFLELTVRQVSHWRSQYGFPLRLLLMNSRLTSPPTREFLRHYTELGTADEIEVRQSMVPKIDAATLRPVQWPPDPDLEWCPPGHGDLYPSLANSGWLERLLKEGIRYLFISNTDNLGATLDPRLLDFFASSHLGFLMEVAERTDVDRKGGHLVWVAGKLKLRETAQVPLEERNAAETIERHRFFNTNNLWVRLDRLSDLLRKHDGFLPLPTIQNGKTVNPREPASPKVWQLETAVGAAIECFEPAQAIVVPRSRFSPAKTTADLVALRSDAYQWTEDCQLILAPSRHGLPPKILLEDPYYQYFDHLDDLCPDGVPSFAECDGLTVRGRVRFGRHVKFRGTVQITNPAGEARPVPDGEYADCTLVL